MNNFKKIIEKYNPQNKEQILMVLNVSFAFITQSNFQLLNTRHFFLMRIPNK